MSLFWLVMLSLGFGNVRECSPCHSWLVLGNWHDLRELAYFSANLAVQNQGAFLLCQLSDLSDLRRLQFSLFARGPIDWYHWFVIRDSWLFERNRWFDLITFLLHLLAFLGLLRLLVVIITRPIDLGGCFLSCWSSKQSRGSYQPHSLATSEWRVIWDCSSIELHQDWLL